MSEWQDLRGFGTLEQAVEFFRGTGSLVEEYAVGQAHLGTISAYKVTDSDGAVLVAQKSDGSGPVRWMPTESTATKDQLRRAHRRQRKRKQIPEQDPSAPRLVPEDQYQVGLWFTSRHDDSSSIVDHWAHELGPNEYTVVEYLWMKAYYVDGDVYEYAQLPSGEIVTRVLHRRGR